MSDLTKLTVNLVPNAVKALNHAAELTGDTRTDTVNRALQVYAALIDASTGEDITAMTWEPSTKGVGPGTVVIVPPGTTTTDAIGRVRRWLRRRSS